MRLKSSEVADKASNKLVPFLRCLGNIGVFQWILRREREEAIRKRLQEELAKVTNAQTSVTVPGDYSFAASGGVPRCEPLPSDSG